MKFSTILAVFAVALSVATTGCKYDKAAKGGAGAGGDDAGAEGIETVDGGEGADGLATAEAGNLSDLDAAGKHFEDLYKRCTDVAFEPVYFGFDSTVIPQGEFGKIDLVVQHLKENPTRVVSVEGHCDDRGSNEYNMSLGENRAIIVRNYLLQNGIAGERIETRSFGEEKPAVVGEDESAWSRNRRGEFAIFETK